MRAQLKNLYGTDPQDVRDGVLHEALHRPPGEAVEYIDRAALILGYDDALKQLRAAMRQDLGADGVTPRTTRVLRPRTARVSHPPLCKAQVASKCDRGVITRAIVLR
ncbi:hypothetical protein STVIR_4062 [Streptomyces viridochromogenes Tue57]|uniref:Uncharacterized protein n=1 Tax=Streptomyces viridochromogenes Tue57 TaxID=1160705 RepID=L8PBA3_STRVR|nr:hypothetical protein STVIR_4062 [Streptomyces viridochromogenes Tue57]